MLQIKTIQKQADAFKEFDADVNAALADGWTLTKRAVLPPFDCGSVYFHRMYYAELEKHILTEDEKCCENCKHHNKQSFEKPCVTCPNGEKWEAEE